MINRPLAVLFTTMLLAIGTLAHGGEIDGPEPVMMTFATPQLAPEMFEGRDDVVRTSSFCGACTTSDDCGSGWVCCSHGCSDDLKKCYNVVSCDKVADETRPLKLFASR
ncbi:MAG: hypothetical protein JJ911_07070 [Rhizobiaceae bacterium]|nr:hypothetical protein [Rhizobiaceae bacterium]